MIGTVDKRTLTNVQRAAMGLPLKGRKVGGRPTGPHIEKAEKIEKPATPPEVRLVKMLTEQVGRFDRLVAQDKAQQTL